MALGTCLNVCGQSKEWKHCKSFMRTGTFVNSPFIAWSQKTCFVLVRIDGKRLPRRWRRLPWNPTEMVFALLLVSSAGEKGVRSEKYGIYTNLLNFLPWVRSVLIKNLMVLTFDKPSYLSHQFWFLINIFFFFNMVAKILTDSGSWFYL